MLKQVKNMNKPIIRKVKVLQGKLKTEAKKQGLSPEDLVIVLENNTVEKIDGDPVSYLLNRSKEVQKK